jgi:hypothetical protein
VSAATAVRTSAARGLAASESQPAIGPPIGVDPRKTVEYSAITRPRIDGSAASCSRAFAPAAKATHTPPRGASRIAATARLGAIATTAASAPKARAATTRNREEMRRRAPV